MGLYRIRIEAFHPLLIMDFSLFEKRRGLQLGPQSYFVENISDFEPGDYHGDYRSGVSPNTYLVTVTSIKRNFFRFN